MTNPEQQAVPVAQEDEARKVLAAEMIDNHAASSFLSGKDRLISTRAALRAMHRFARLTPIEGVAASALEAGAKALFDDTMAGRFAAPSARPSWRDVDESEKVDWQGTVKAIFEAARLTAPATSPAIPEGKSGDGGEAKTIEILRRALAWHGDMQRMATTREEWQQTIDEAIVWVKANPEPGRVSFSSILLDPVPDATQTREAEGQSFEALERFITDHEGHDETSDGLDVDRRAREALSALRIVVSAALAVCHSGDDDCTNGRVVTIDPDAFDALNAALDKVGKEGDDDRLTGEEAWDVLVNVDDRTSPEEYPDMCLITRDELIGFMARAALNARGGA